MRKKGLGIIFFLAGAWLAYGFRHDLVSGQHTMGVVFRVTGILVSVSGYFLFFEGLKQEIIEAIKKKNSKEIQDN